MCLIVKYRCPQMHKPATQPLKQQIILSEHLKRNPHAGAHLRLEKSFMANPGGKLP